MRRIESGSKPKNIKDNNRKAILSLFRFSEELSLGDVAKTVKLSKTTVKKIVFELLEQGYIVSAGKGASTGEGGKKPNLFRFNPVRKYIIVLSMNTISTAACIYLMDLASEFHYQEDLVFGEGPISYGNTVKVYADAVNRTKEKFGLKAEQIYAITLATDGIVDVQKGRLAYSFHNQWEEDMPFADDLSAAMALSPVPHIFLENICSYLGYAELISTDYHNSNVAFIYADVHTGGCIIRKGSLVHSNRGYSGEFGHMILDDRSDTVCSCGARGCFEALVSTERLLKRARAGEKRCPDSLVFCETPLNLQTIFAAANKDDAFARELMDEIIRWFSLAINNITIVYDPDVVIIQGSYREAGEYFINGLYRAIRALPFYRGKYNPSIIYSRIDQALAMAKGGSYYATAHYLQLSPPGEAKKRKTGRV